MQTGIRSAYTACQVYFSTMEGSTTCGIDGMHSQKFFNSSDVTLNITDDKLDTWTATAKHNASNVTYTIDPNGTVTVTATP